MVIISWQVSIESGKMTYGTDKSLKAHSILYMYGEYYMWQKNAKTAH